MKLSFWKASPAIAPISLNPEKSGSTEKIPREMGIIDNQPRSATVTAMEKSKVSLITQECFHSMEMTNPEALMPLLRVLSARIRDSLKLLNPQNPPTCTFKKFQDRQKPSTQLFTMSYISYKIYLDSGSSLFP